MIEFNAVIKANEALQGASEINFLHYVGHKKEYSVYGSLFKTNEGLLFIRHKWTEINKNKPKPKVSAEMQYTAKKVTEDIYNSFEILDNPSYLGREVVDWQTV